MYYEWCWMEWLGLNKHIILLDYCLKENEITVRNLWDNR